MPVFDWKITSQKKEIQGYSCILAIMNFRGRDYEAWFTPDIPLQEGPWKFGRLPGLIMAIKDTQGHYVFECIGIKQAKEPVLIKYFNRRYEECSREKFRATMKKIHDYPQQWTQSIGDRGLRIVGERENRNNLAMIYNPIELE
jgi:GLPGLI family protein